ncbi:unnamed protein product, partial [marine sediment metagenome]
YDINMDVEIQDGAPGEAEDNQSPFTSGHNPAANATNIADNTNIIVHVQDSGDGVDQSSIVMTVDGEAVNPTISGNQSDYTLTYDPPANFLPQQVVTVTVEAQDIHDPPNIMAPTSWSFTIAEQPDEIDPTVAITGPTSEETYSTEQGSITLTGTASDNVGVTSVSWTNSRGGSGTASGTTNWTINNIALSEDENVITVAAEDGSGNTQSDSIMISYTVAEQPDEIDPTVAITGPTSEETYSTEQGSITLTGTASDNVGVTSVSWTNSRGGSGTASGTTNWTINNIALSEDENVITVAAEDGSGNTQSDTVMVSYTVPAGTYTSIFGDTSGSDYPGT